MSWMRQLLDWQREAADPGDFLEQLRYDLGAAGDLRLHAEGRRDHAAREVDAGRLRLRRAHRGRQPVHRLAGQRQAGRAGAQAGVRRRHRDLHVQGRGRRGPAATGCPSSRPRAPRPRSSSGSPRSAAKRPSRRARRRSPARRGARRCRCSGWCRPTRWPRCRTSCTSRISLRSTPRWGRATSSARHVVQRLTALLGGEEQAEEDLAERATPSTVRQRAGGDGGRGRAGRRRGRRRSLHEAGQLLHPGARRRHPGLRDPRRRRLGAPHRLHERR